MNSFSTMLCYVWLMFAKEIKLNVTVNDVLLEDVSTAKLLGVYVDKSLDWKVQVQKLCAKISKKLGLLRRLKRVIPHSALMKLFYAIVMPNFDYCDIIWSNCSQNTLHTIEMLQKQSARIILGARRYSHTQPLFNKLKWLPISSRIKYHKAVMVYKSLNNGAPVYLQDMFRRVNDVHQRTTRNSVDNKLFVPFSRLECGKLRFSVQGANIWNNIPNHIRNANTIRQFKRLYLSQQY